MKKMLKSLLAIILVVTMVVPTITVFAATSVPYKKTGTVYTVSGKSYYQAKTTSAYNGVSADSEFWLDKNNNIVTETVVLNKLYRMSLFEEYNEDGDFFQLFKNNITVSNDLRDTYIDIVNHDKTCDIAGMIIGETADIASKVVSGPVSWVSIALDIMVDGALISTSDAATVATIQMFEVYINNAIYYATEGLKYKNTQITDYDNMMYVVDCYAKSAASKEAAWEICGEEITEISEMNWFEFGLSNFWKIFESVAFSIFPSDTLDQMIASAATDGVLGFVDIVENLDVENVYENTYNQRYNTFGFIKADSSQLVSIAAKLTSTSLNKTVGSMTSSSSKSTYTTDEKVVITWTKADNATRYGLTIINNATNEKVVNASNFTGTSYTVGKLPAGTYRFNMCGYDSNGKSGPISELKQFTIVNNTSSGSSGKYNAAAAIEYGRNHWNDGKGLCAEFVSNCLKAGGSSAWYVGCTTLVKQLQEENWGTLHKLNVNSNGTISLEKNKSILSPGDPIFVYSSGCLSVDGKPYVHVYLYYDTDSNGNLKGYAHNNASNGTIDVYYTCAYCGKPTDAAYVFHMDSSDSKQTPDNNETNTQEYADIHEGTYVINSIVNDYRYLTAKTDSNGGQVEAKPFENIDAQLFEIIECKDGYQIICKNSPSGRVINVYRDGTSKNGDNVTLWASTKDGTQIWLFEKNGDAYAIHPSDNKNISLTAGNTGKVTVSSYTGASNQLWKLSLQREEPEQYTVTYNGNGGTGIPKEQTKTAGEDLKLSSTVPIKEGHTFKGWATTKTGSVSYKSGEQYASDKDITLYAVWEANTYTISYNANGGKGTPGTQTKIHAESIKLSTQEPTRKDYIFLGWSTSADGSVEFAPGSVCSVNENITLYALWQEEENEVYYIIYNANGGKNAPSMQTKNEDEDITISDIVPTREGYTFDGWAIGNDDTVVYSCGDIYKENKTLYLHAVWTANTYTISYNANGGFGAPRNQTKIHDEDIVLSTAEPEKEGCMFIGWSDDPNAQYSEYYAGSVFDKNGDTMLYAVWEEVKDDSEEKLPFIDIPEDAWYRKDVENAYKNGLINGKGEKRYAPNENMTYAEAIKLACTIYQLYYDGEVTLNNGSDVWYSTYMDYALKNRIVRTDYSSVANEYVTRKEFVNIFYGALPLKEFAKINNVEDNIIPDVKIGDAYSGEIYTFYRAGILTGNDAKGTFKPDSNISRSEVAAIVTRMLDSGARKTISLK